MCGKNARISNRDLAQIVNLLDKNFRSGMLMQQNATETQSEKLTRAMKEGERLHAAILGNEKYYDGFSDEQQDQVRIKRAVKLQKALETLRSPKTPRSLKMAENLINKEIALAFHVHGDYTTFRMTDIPNIYKFCRASLRDGKDLNEAMILAVKTFSIPEPKLTQEKADKVFNSFERALKDLCGDENVERRH